MTSRSVKNKKRKIVAVFDIGTSMVSGAIVALSSDTDTRPIVLSTAHAPIRLLEEFDFNRFYGLVVASLEAVATSLALHRHVSPEKVFCFLSSPWYASQARTITYSRPKEFLFTKKFARELIERDLKAFEATYLKNYVEIGSPAETIENKIIDIRLNGYTTPEPFGKRAKELSLHLFFSMSPRALLEAFEHVIHRTQKVVPVSFHSFAFASYVVARDTIARSIDFLIVDTAGEMTDVSIVADGILRESISFPCGKNAFVRTICTEFAITEKEAQSLIRSYTRDMLEKKTKERIRKSLITAGKIWSRNFQEALFQLTQHTSIPRTVVLTADEDIGSIFKKEVETEEFSQYMRTPGMFNVILFEYALLRRFCKVSEEAERDTFLMLESLFVSKLL
ncbi:MAG: hypothetical protein MUD00_03485 [Candidatus Pacebacteria bacterium]|jgi:cell division ATPase FtsA|nr:hypothetical protein [Candidatus Paceibacterota bacterium]